MSKGSKKFTVEEKTEIARKAVSGSGQTIAELAEKHAVSVDEIRAWIRETGVASVRNSEESQSEEVVDLEASDSFIESVNFGATHDILNYGRLIFWTLFGTAVVVSIIISIVYIYDYTFSGVAQQSSERSQFYEISQLKQQAELKLNSFGVVDPEEGIYHIPVDSAISNMVEEFE